MNIVKDIKDWESAKEKLFKYLFIESYEVSNDTVMIPSKKTLKAEIWYLNLESDPAHHGDGRAGSTESTANAGQCPWASYQTRTIADYACAENAGSFYPANGG